MKTKEQYISTKVQTLKPSGIRKFFDLAASMEGVISLGVGEPDFVTPWHMREASILSLEQGYTAYTANAGLKELREEISTYLEKRFSVSYRAEDEILVTVGASQALDLAFRAILNEGDEVLIPEPCFVSYDSLVSLAGGVPVHVQTSGDTGFQIDIDRLKEALSEKTKAIVLCSPSNPTGAVLSKAALKQIADLAEEHDLIVIADEIYAELTYDQSFISFASLPKMRERTILISGFSKGFAMTGWRLGYIAADSYFLHAMLKIHQYSVMCAPAMAQFAALEALQNGLAEVEKMRKSYRQRRNYFVESLNEIGLHCHNPGGAFYAFPSIQQTSMSSEQFAEALLLEEKVAVVPGSVFGPSGEGYIRCSYASSLDHLQEAIKRMDKFMKKMSTS
ncbi:aminotransferase [Bacillus kexueae]|uniref:aminotransferase n=1 Tax=Aeribacillus kexueae TaxID=2078952 RepID=UPI001FAF4D46|nr:aminotransferase [Bacillus kexueae]